MQREDRSLTVKFTALNALLKRTYVRNISTVPEMIVSPSQKKVAFHYLLNIPDIMLKTGSMVVNRINMTFSYCSFQSSSMFLAWGTRKVRDICLPVSKNWLQQEFPTPQTLPMDFILFY